MRHSDFKDTVILLACIISYYVICICAGVHITNFLFPNGGWSAFLVAITIMYVVADMLKQPAQILSYLPLAKDNRYIRQTISKLKQRYFWKRWTKMPAIWQWKLKRILRWESASD